MPTPYFQFKQFTVWHDLCAMKVGTDGVLLGALAPLSPCTTSILDIGTGSGLVALMLAQRCSTAAITAIDCDEGAYQQASLNFEASPWNERLTVLHRSLQEFQRLGLAPFDLIVSNPPFFANSLKAPDKARTTARHNDTLSIDELLFCSEKLLQKTGSIVLILPVSDQLNCVKLAERYGLCCHASTLIVPKPGAAPKRVVLVFSRLTASLQIRELMIETAVRGHYTPEFTALVRDFYLKL
jgi:tRNA1Val (adenine37-N6)-methyltransferase